MKNDSKKIVSILDVKNKHILNIIFKNLQVKNLLQLIRYNKILQKKFQKDINDYKEYLKMEILLELKPLNCISYSEHIRFIHPSNISYFHIYFNDNKEEAGRNYLIQGDNVTKIKIIIDYENKSFSGLFDECRIITKIIFVKFNRKDIKDMRYMFSGCSSLEEINFTNFHTDNVVNMSYMFEKCSYLQKLDLSCFNTSNVTNMSYMFYECRLLKKLNMSNFNTSNVTNMSCMFYGCESFKRFNLSNFNTSKVTNMRNMFGKCCLLKELNISSFQINDDTNIDDIFSECYNLKYIENENENIINKFEEIIQISNDEYSY